jgi:hypothetical protein
VLSDSRLARRELFFVGGWMHSCDKIREPIYQSLSMDMTIKLSMLRWENVKELLEMLNSWKGSK